MTDFDQTAAHIAEKAAARLLAARGVERGVGEIDQPGIEPAIQAFAWELGDGGEWSYEEGLKALVYEALLVAAEQQPATDTVARTNISDEDLQTLVDAAEKWSTELDDYVIPFAEESDAADAAEYRAEMAQIDDALARTRPHLTQEN